MDQLKFKIVHIERKQEEAVDVNLPAENIEKLVTLMARSMWAVLRSAKEKYNEWKTKANP